MVKTPKEEPYRAPFNLSRALYWLDSLPPRPSLTGTLITKKKLSIPDVGKLVGASSFQIRKLIDAWYKGPEAMRALNWERGRPFKLGKPNDKETAEITSRKTLKKQIGTTLKARA